VIAEVHPSKRSRFIACACAVVSMVVGCVVLVGWALDVTALKTVVPGTVMTRPDRAIPCVELTVGIRPPTPAL